MASVGGTVWYVPGEAHKYERQPDGLFAWQFCQAKDRSKTPLTDQQVFETLRRAARRKGTDAANDIEPLGPQVRWPATVVELQENGTATLDIANPCLPGVTLHYTVPADPTGDKSHTWHEGD